MGVVSTSENLLRQRRLERQITIDEVVHRTKLPRLYAEMIDAGRLGDLPAGIYGRSYVRAFAQAVGVDPDHALTLYSSLLVDTPDPIPAIREIARERTAPTLAGLVADRIRAWYATRDGARPFRWPGTVYFAASFDALFLFAINAFVVAVAAHACQVSVQVLLRLASPAIAVVCAFTSTMYFLLLAGIGGQTLGMRLFGTRLRSGTRPLGLYAIGLRAADAVLGQGSVLVDWLCSSEMPKRRESPV